ncbi:mechanosensitive ion channel domain-containing protein [Pseudahrensia aquimaris]|uniref:Mechanosensitive ion channel domain-containing protein n=1 Tax=Pseudahrensia aquimaris TaxID=744461 RepID=A0ABW3FEE6_9HYPH
MKSLENAAAEQKANGEPAAEDQPQRAASARTAATKIASITKSYAEYGLLVIKNFASDISGIWESLSAPGTFDLYKLLGALWPITATIVTTLAVWLGVDRFTRYLLTPVKWRLGTDDIVPSSLLIAFYLTALITSFGIAYAAGNVLAVTYFGGEGVSIYQALYLNAFGIFGAAVVVIRLLTGSVDGELGLIGIQPTKVDYIRLRSRMIAAVLIFGLGFVVPALNVGTTFALGRGVRVLVFTFAAVLAVLLIRRLAAQPSLLLKAGDDQTAPANSSRSIGSRVWPVIAYGYVAFAYVTALTRPFLFIEYIGGATLKSAIALVAGGLLIRLFAKLSRAQIHAPQFLPLDSGSLSKRLQTLFPFILKAVRLVVALTVVGVILDAWQFVDIGGWLTSDTGSGIVSGVLSALFVLLFVALFWAIASSWIDQQIEANSADPLEGARKRTLFSLLRSALTVALIVFGGMIALSELGVDIGPLLAGAGVLGLAIGFGAQKLVQDIISGVFIQLENAMNVGDVVNLGGTTGTVEHLTLRSASLRDVHGVYHIIPFSAMDTVSNYMRGFSYHVSEVGIAYKEKVEDGKNAMLEAYERLMQTDFASDIIAPLEVHGVTSLGDSAVTIRARIKTVPGKQFALGRAYTELVKEVMDERDIEIPFPHSKLVIDQNVDVVTASKVKKSATSKSRKRAAASKSGPVKDT